MHHIILKAVYLIAFINILYLLVLPVIHRSKGLPNPLLQTFVIPISSSHGAAMSFTVSHIEILLQRNIPAGNIALVAMGQGIYLLEECNSQYHLRVQALLEEGVQVYACESSMQRLTTNLAAGRFQLMAGVKMTADGKQLVDSLMNAGFVSAI